MVVPAEGLNRLTQISTHTPANAPVTRKVRTVLPRILPRRFMLTMAPTAEAMDAKTRGTTMVNIRFRKISPKGFSLVPKPGATMPMMAPMAMPPKSRMGILYCPQNDFFMIMSPSYFSLLQLRG